MHNAISKSKWLLLREFYSLIIKIFASFFLMKLVGPAQFGMYASVVGLIMFLTAICQMGINIFIVKEDFDKKNLIQGFTLSLISSLSLTLILIPCIIFFFDLKLLILIVLPTLILSNLKIVSLGLLEKNVEYKKISLIDFVSQLIFYLTSFLLYKFGAKGLCLGYLLSVIYSFLHTIRFYPICFQLMMPSKKMLCFSLSYTFSNFGWQTRNLINMILLPIFGATNVGYISFATKLCDSANIIKDTTRRVSIKMLSGENKNISNLINRGMIIQVFSICSLMSLMVLFFPIINKFMGKDWNGASEIILFSAIFYCFGSFFNIQSMFLTILNKNLINGFYLLIQTFSIIVISLLLYSHFGITSYCISLIVSSFSGFFIYIGLKDFKIKHKQAVIYLLFFLFLIISSKFFWWSPALSLALLLNKNTRDLIKNTFQAIKGK